MAEVAVVFTELISRGCIEDVDRDAASDSGVNISCNLESNSVIIVLTC